jgi:hypothetical protein
MQTSKTVTILGGNAQPLLLTTDKQVPHHHHTTYDKLVFETMSEIFQRK